MSADKQDSSLHLAANTVQLHVFPDRSRRQFIAVWTGTLLCVTNERLDIAGGTDKLYWSDKIKMLFILGC